MKNEKSINNNASSKLKAYNITLIRMLQLQNWKPEPSLQVSFQTEKGSTSNRKPTIFELYEIYHDWNHHKHK